MNRFEEALGKYNLAKNELDALEVQYEGTIKGVAYDKRKNQLLSKMSDTKASIMNIGVGQRVCIIKGKILRPHAKNAKIKVQSNFTLYFTGISDEEVPQLLNLRLKNVIQYTVTFVQTGVIHTSS